MSAERYVLATGAEAVDRLRAVQTVHGPDTEAFLRRSGIRPGMTVADVGCGVGFVSRFLTEQVGPHGHVVALDVSAAQAKQAWLRASGRSGANCRFLAASAYSPGLPRAVFDLVFARFVLMHLRDPDDAFTAMCELARPGGTVAVEDGDFAAPFCYPPSEAYDRCFELYRLAGRAHGADFCLGPKLYGMALRTGLCDVTVSLAQPVFVRGPARRLPEWTLEECAPDLLHQGLANRAEIDSLLNDLRRLASNEDTLFGMARMTQVCGRTPGGEAA